MYPEYIELQGNKRSGTLYKEIIKLQQENKQLQSNWNSLREWLFSEYLKKQHTEENNLIRISLLLDKMNELEGGDKDNGE